MALPQIPSIDGGSGGISPSSSAQSGQIRQGDRAYGGINIAPNSGLSLNTTTIAIGVGIVVLGLYAKSKGWI